MKLESIGRTFITFCIRAVTGLHIGGRGGGIEIGGIDNPVIRDPLTNRPLIPGSSLKGKIRSLMEKQLGLPPNRKIGQTFIHNCEDAQNYRACSVCHVFGLPGELGFNTPTRLLVRDIPLEERSASEMESLSLDRPYTEVKTEVSIDRITSAANPRPVERVPAGAVFAPGEMVYTVYASDDGRCDPRQDVDFLGTLFEGIQLLEHDYLGGSGSRGSGKVAFENIQIVLRRKADYFEHAEPVGSFPTLSELMTAREDLLGKIRKALGIEEAAHAGGAP